MSVSCPLLAAAPAGTPLLLDVTLNGVSVGLIAAFTELPDGGLAIAPSELAEIGIAANPAAAGSAGLIVLRRMPGLTYRYDVPRQSIAILIGVGGLQHHALSGATKAAGPPENGRGVVLNYDLFGSLDGDWSPEAAASLDARAFFDGNLFTQSGLARAGDGGNGIVRLDTTLSRSDPESLVTWNAGDFISGGLAWTRPIRMGGFQVERNFALRPDLVTMPVPGFSGSAAVPSTVDVYANGARVFSSPVPGGPFILSDIPVVTGAGTARVVVTDALGRQSVSELPFFASSLLLRKGLSDFSVEAGLPRLSYGVTSDDYAAPAASASLRYGISDTLTLESHAEATAGLANAGLGVVMPVGRLGVASFAAAGSVGDHAGIALNGGFDLAFGRIALRLHSMHTLGDYSDVAAITAPSPAGYERPPQALDQASLSFALPGSATAALSLTRIVDDEPSAFVGLSYSRPVWNDASLSINAFASIEGDSKAGVFVSLSRALAGGISASASASLSDHATGAVELAKPGTSETGSLGWRLDAATGTGADDTQLAAAASYRAADASFAGAVHGNGRTVYGNAEMNGAVVFAGGETRFANRIDDAFAIVDVGAPGVEVYSENRPIGRTDSQGKLLVTGLHAYQKNALSIDADDLPLDADATRLKAGVVPADRAGVVVDFGVHAVKGSAIVVLHGSDGAVIPAGYAGRLDGGGDFVVGYDGEAFVSGLHAANTAVVDLGNGQKCTAHFAFDTSAGGQPIIEGVPCL